MVADRQHEKIFIHTSTFVFMYLGIFWICFGILFWYCDVMIEFLILVWLPLVRLFYPALKVS